MVSVVISLGSLSGRLYFHIVLEPESIREDRVRDRPLMW